MKKCNAQTDVVNI